jgi:AraC-like DNA-binding protein
MGIPQEEISTIGSVASLIYKALEHYGIEPEALFSQVGIDVKLLGDPNMRFPMHRLQKLWKLSVETTMDETFGLVAAEQMQPAMLHGLGFAWLASDTLHDALKRLVRYARLLNSHAKIDLIENNDTLELVFNRPIKDIDIAPVTIDVALAIFLRMCRLTAMADIQPLAIYFARTEPVNIEAYEQYFNAPIYFNAESSKIIFNRVDMDNTLPMSNPELARINDETVIQYLARFDKSSIIMKVRAQIIEKLPAGAADQANIADALHLSLRSMQRKLKEKDTNYRSLLEDTRKDLALQYIKECHHSISEITYMLGFSEPSNFTRAFKRWTGYAPVDFRESRGSEVSH